MFLHSTHHCFSFAFKHVLPLLTLWMNASQVYFNAVRFWHCFKKIDLVINLTYSPCLRNSALSSFKPFNSSDHIKMNDRLFYLQHHKQNAFQTLFVPSKATHLWTSWTHQTLQVKSFRHFNEADQRSNYTLEMLAFQTAIACAKMSKIDHNVQHDSSFHLTSLE